MKNARALRHAALAAVNAFFDALEAAERAEPKRTVVRPPPRPEREYSDVERAHARAVLERHGVR